MIKAEESKTLLSIISATDQTLKQLEDRFLTEFDLKTRIISIKILSLLLSDGILNHQQQVAAFWLVYRSFDSVVHEEHPFWPLFVHLYEFKTSRPNICSPMLYTILSCLLSKESVDTIADFSIGTILGNDFQLLTPKNIEPKEHRVSFERISPLFMEYKNNESNILSNNDLIMELLQNPSYSYDFEAPFSRNPPALSPIFEHELDDMFLLSDYAPNFVFDDSPTLYAILEGKELIIKSAQDKLSNDEIATLCKIIEHDTSITSNNTLKSEQFGNIIEKNPKIASFLVTTSFGRRPDLVNQLYMMKTSKNIIQIVKSLKNSGLISNEFLIAFINTAIATLPDIDDSGPIYSALCDFLAQIPKGQLSNATKQAILSLCNTMGKYNIKEEGVLRELIN